MCNHVIIVLVLVPSEQVVRPSDHMHRNALFILIIIFNSCIRRKNMKNFTTYLSTAPVVASIWFIFTAGLLIEINRFFPDIL
jgi:photosystem I subunit 9